MAFNVPVAEFHTERSLARYSQVPKLGVDVLSDQYTVEKGIASMRAYGEAHPEAEIAVVLLNQRVLAGLGNVYKSEVAFAAGVNPFRAMATITDRELEVMADVAQKWMKVNVADGAGDGIVTYSGNRRTTGATNREERLFVYGRQGQECRRCGALVQMRKAGGAGSEYVLVSCMSALGAHAGAAGGGTGGQDGEGRRASAEDGLLKENSTVTNEDMHCYVLEVRAFPARNGVGNGASALCGR